MLITFRVKIKELFRFIPIRKTFRISFDEKQSFQSRLIRNNPNESQVRMIRIDSD